MAAAVKWTDQLVLQFVQLYRDRPCLWQSDHPDYKCKKTRTDALRSLVRNMDVEGFDLYACKMKIKNMRSYYCHKLRKICRRKDGEERHQPSLIWFPLVHSFLNKYVHYVNPETSPSSKKIADDDCAYEDNDIECSKLVSNQSTSIEEEEKRTFPKDSRKYKRFKAEPESQEKTEFDVFSKSVAEHLNSLPLENALRLQHNIQNLVIEERLRCIRDAQASQDIKYQFED
ncbi:uncharacterized protein LOC143913775 [Arctopsyche grandis]|uniref:uncharacterized protein LOC143913775 n=1 Tax=Arctopsyche grandis TaxID=121162 RepID=UPI00406D8A39